MLDSVAVDARPGRLGRVVGILLVGAIASAPVAMVSEPTPGPPTTRCEMHREGVRPAAKIQTRAPGVNPRYLQRDLDHRR